MCVFVGECVYVCFAQLQAEIFERNVARILDFHQYNIFTICTKLHNLIIILTLSILH